MTGSVTARPFNSWDAIKILALLLMFVDHSGAFFFRHESEQWLRAIGRGAAPIFLFLAGYASSYRFKWDLFFLAALMTVSDTLLAGHLRTQNILVTIILTRMFLNWYERKGEIIKRPQQMLMGCVAWLVTMLLFQYGTFGLMFGLCGYVKRRRDYFGDAVAKRMLVITFALFAAVTQWSFEFAWYGTLIMLATISCVCWLLMRFELKAVDTSKLPAPLVWTGKQVSHYSGYIYALHLIALEWITGFNF